MNRRPAAVVLSFCLAFGALVAGDVVGADILPSRSAHAAGPRLPSTSAPPAAVSSAAASRSFADLETAVTHLLDAADASGSVSLTQLSSNQSSSPNPAPTFLPPNPSTPPVPITP